MAAQAQTWRGSGDLSVLFKWNRQSVTALWIPMSLVLHASTGQWDQHEKDMSGASPAKTDKMLLSYISWSLSDASPIILELFSRPRRSGIFASARNKKTGCQSR